MNRYANVKLKPSVSSVRKNVKFAKSTSDTQNLSKVSSKSPV